MVHLGSGLGGEVTGSVVRLTCMVRYPDSSTQSQFVLNTFSHSDTLLNWSTLLQKSSPNHQDYHNLNLVSYNFHIYVNMYIVKLPLCCLKCDLVLPIMLAASSGVSRVRFRRRNIVWTPAQVRSLISNCHYLFLTPRQQRLEFDSTRICPAAGP